MCMRTNPLGKKKREGKEHVKEKKNDSRLRKKIMERKS